MTHYKNSAGHNKGTVVSQLLTYLRTRQEQSFSPKFLAEELKVSEKTVHSALSSGFATGVYSREKRGAYSYYRFEKMPEVKPQTPQPRGPNKAQQKYSEMLYTRRMKNEEYAEFKRSNTAKPDAIIPPDVKITGMKLPENFGNRYAVKADEVPLVFSALRPGQYLEAA
jgi:hypothetical protein